MKAKLVLFLLLSVLIVSVVGNPSKAQQEETKTVWAIVELRDGKMLNFTTYDDLLLNIYRALKNGSLKLDDIKKVEVRDWDAVINGTAVNETAFVPAYSKFFVYIDNASKYNYFGNIIGTKLSDFLTAKYKYMGLPIYGRVESVELKLAGANESLTEADLVGATLLIILNSSEEQTNIEQYVNVSTQDIKTIIVDVANSLVLDNVTVVWAENSTFDGIPILEALGIDIEAYPVIVGMFYDMVVWKSWGDDTLELTLQHLRNLLNASYERWKIASYEASIFASRLMETKIGYVIVYLSDGLGNATIKLHYEVLDEKGKVIDSENKTTKADRIGAYEFEIEFKNGSRRLIVTVNVESEFGTTQVTAEFNVEKISEKKKEREVPWARIIAIILAIVLMVMIIFTARPKR